MISIFCLTFLVTGFGQSYTTTNKKAIKRYSEAEQLLRVNRDFEGAIDMFNQATSIDPEFVEAYKRIAATSEMLGRSGMKDPKGEDYNQIAFDAYKKVVALSPNDKNFRVEHYKYTVLLLRNENYAEAKKVSENAISLFSKGEPYLEKIKFLNACAVFGDSATSNPHKIAQKELPKEINRFAYNSKPVLTADGEEMVYCVRNNVGNQDENILLAKKNVNGDWSEGESISPEINTPLNEGMATISGDGKTLVYTHCNAKGNCDLFISSRIGGEWSKPINMGGTVNSDAWDSEPTLAADGRKIYFASDRKGGYGKFDLYVTKKNNDGKWSKPENLGPIVNTAQNEVTPFIHADGTHLYFASDGHVGLGGYDVFESKLKQRNRWTTPQNLGYPINTSANEGGMYISPDYTVAYLEKMTLSNANRAISSKIYELEVPTTLQKTQNSNYVKGKIYSMNTKEPLEALITLVDIKTRDTIQAAISDPVTGEYILVVTAGQEYALEVEAIPKGYLFYSQHFFLERASSLKENKYDIGLSTVHKGQRIVMDNVFFKHDSFELDQKSYYELNVLLKYLHQYPSLRLLIEGHTDNKGANDYNLRLSEKRASKVKEYLISKGVASSRLEVKGFGKTRPLVSNDTEEGRSKNRRIAFEVINY